MGARRFAFILSSFTALAVSLTAAAVVHDALVSALEGKFPPSKTGSNATVFSVLKEGLMAYPPGTLMVPDNRIVNGNVEHSRLLGMTANANPGAAELAPGTRVYVTKIESKNELVKVQSRLGTSTIHKWLAWRLKSA